MNTPVVTVALPSYNHARFLRGALDAILGQLPVGLEVLVIDDASSDESFEILEQYAACHPAMRVLRNPENLGVQATVNRCIELAQGRFINFAAVDDRMLPGLLPRAVAMLEENPGAAFCTCPVRYIDEFGEAVAPWPGPPLAVRRFIDPDGALSMMRRHGFWVVAAGTLYRLDLVREAGGYDGSIGHMADSFLAQTLALRHGFCVLPDHLAEVRIMAASYSASERANPEAAQAVRQRTEARMLEDPARFSPDFVRDWSDLWRFLDALQVWQHTILGRQKAFLGRELSRFRPSPTLWDRAFVVLLKAMGLLQFLTLTLWGGLHLLGNPLVRPYISIRRIGVWVRKQSRWK